MTATSIRVATAIVLSCVGGRRAADAQPTPAPTANLEDTVALGAFLDGVVRTQMEQFTIPSAAVVVVKGERVLYTRGYGWQDIEDKVPVDPATTMFHIGSTGKLFTWTAVMQLVEQGKLDLDTDVNRYLKTFQLPATFPQPITLRHLMTHTAGFQEGVLGYYIGTDSTNVRSIDETLRWHVPARVRPPGLLTSYSNYGASLAGLIVEQVSGEPFVEYIERHIYRPLGIRYATFREPIPAELRRYAAVGYEPEDGVFARHPFEINGGFVPSGGTVMSTLDLARFMMAHLRRGRLGDSVILRPETADAMHRTAFTHDPRMPGLGLGFIESSFNGHRIIGHDGDSKDFHVGMWLVPEADVGLYVAYGASGGDIGREQLARAFFDRFFPRVEASTPISPDPAPDLQRYAGDYRIIRMNYTDIDKLIWFGIAPTQVSVSVLPNGRLLMSGQGGHSPPGQFVPLGDHLFREVAGDRRIGFEVDSDGSVRHLFTNPTVDYERVPWNERTGFWYPVLLVSFIVLIGALVGAFYRTAELWAMQGAERRAIRLMVMAIAWLLLTLVAIVAVVATYQATLTERIPLALKIVLVMPVGFVVLTVLLVANAVLVWRRGYWGGLGRRVHYSLVTVAALMVCWFFYQWNILGWQFG